MADKGVPGPERFHTTDQFRELSKGILNYEHLARICVFEAMQPGTNLKRFLAQEVLFGNKGKLDTSEMRDLARELFVSERATGAGGYLTQLRHDNCLGFSAEEEDAIIALLETPFCESLHVALAIGYRPPRPRY